VARAVENGRRAVKGGCREGEVAGRGSRRRHSPGRRHAAHRSAGVQPLPAGTRPPRRVRAAGEFPCRPSATPVAPCRNTPPTRAPRPPLSPPPTLHSAGSQ
jgi:hypothetical protein